MQWSDKRCLCSKGHNIWGKRYYHRADVESNSCKVKCQHPEEVKELTKPVYISTQHLLSIASCYFSLKKCNLVKPHISTFSNLKKYTRMRWYILQNKVIMLRKKLSTFSKYLYILVMCNIALTESRIEPYKILINFSHLSPITLTFL